VAVSIASGVAAVVSMAPALLAAYREAICLAFIALIAIANLHWRKVPTSRWRLRAGVNAAGARHRGPLGLRGLPNPTAAPPRLSLLRGLRSPASQGEVALAGRGRRALGEPGEGAR